MPNTEYLSSLNVLIVSHRDDVTNTIVRGLPGATTTRVYNPELAADRDQLRMDDHDVVVVFRSKADPALLDHLSSMLQRYPLPLLLFVESDDDSLARQAIRAGVSSFVVDGLQQSRIATLVEIAIERFKLNDALHRELLKSQESLAARKSVERAKGLLMDRRGMSEQDAYRALREMAMQQSKTIRDVADALISVSGLLP
ncbi:MAG: ANTAR domain-containing protein [Henriciella sp.]|nr:ANTAR domain-containing protein [Henriciella sp.]